MLSSLKPTLRNLYQKQRILSPFRINTSEKTGVGSRPVEVVGSQFHLEFEFPMVTKESRQVLLDKAGTQMHVHLHQWTIPDGFEAMNLASLDDENIAGAAFKGLSVHGPNPAPLAHNLD